MSETRRFAVLMACAACAGLVLTIALVAVQGWRDRQLAAKYASQAEAGLRDQVAAAETALYAAQKAAREATEHLQVAQGREAVCLAVLGRYGVRP